MKSKSSAQTGKGMNQKNIAVIGTLDTKGDQIAYIRKIIKTREHKAVIIDVGILDKPTCRASVSREKIADAAGSSINELIAFNDENKAMNKMAEGTCIILKDLYEKGKVDGALALGGSMATSLALKVMDVLPIGFPKIILSTVAYSPSINPDSLGNGVVMMQWVGGIWGLNDLVRKFLEQAAAFVTAGAEVYKRGPVSRKKILGITSLGMSAARYLYHLKPRLESEGFEIAAFHPTGMNTRTLERAVKEEKIDAVLDLRIGSELLSQVTGSLFASCSTRLEAAAKRGIPLVVSPAGMEAILWAPYKKVPLRFKGRISFKHNPLLWVYASTIEEKVKVARLMVKKLNMGAGPAAVVIALQFSPMQAKYGIRDIKGLNAFRKILKENLKPHVKVVEVNATYDDKEFGREVVRLLEEMTQVKN